MTDKEIEDFDSNSFDLAYELIQKTAEDLAPRMDINLEHIYFCMLLFSSRYFRKMSMPKEEFVLFAGEVFEALKEEPESSISRIVIKEREKNVPS